MLNVNALQKTLAAMSLPEIQKYASLHKNDPYVVAMALSVANTKKEAQTAQQGLAGMQPQPKVVDQDIASIAPQAPAPAMAAAQLPEDTGIGQLPVPETAYAEGGIVAFEGGGHVPRYNGAVNGSQVSGTGYTFDPNTGELVEDTYVPKPFIESYGKGLAIDPLKNRPELKAALQKEIAARAGNPEKVKGAAPLAAQTARTNYADIDPRRTDIMGMQNFAGSRGGQDTTQQAGLNQLAPAGGGVPQAGIGQFMDFLKANKPANPEAMDTWMQRRNEYLGENPTAKQMERIDKQEIAALADKEEAKAMSIIKAGLGMMSGTSRSALANIAEGAKGGLEEYVTSQKDAKKLKLERDRMRDAIENAAYAYKKGDMDAYDKYAQDAKNAQNTYAAHGLAALGSVTGHQISAAATLGAAATSAGATKEYLNAVRGGSMIESVRKDIAAEVNKLYPYPTQDAEREAAFQKKWMAALQANPLLAKLSGGATGGGGAVDTTGFKVLGVR